VLLLLEMKYFLENTTHGDPFMLDILREALLTKQDGHTGKVQDNKGKKKKKEERLIP